MELGIDANPVIPDVEDVRSVRSFVSTDSRNPISTSLLGLIVVFDRIGDEITEYLGHARLVADDMRQHARHDDARVALAENVSIICWISTITALGSVSCTARSARPSREKYIRSLISRSMRWQS